MKLLLIFIFIVTFQSRGYSQMNEVVDSNNSLAFEMYRQSVSGTQNLLLSPTSLESVIAMASAGAKAETLQQILQTLKLTGDYHSGFHSLSDALLDSPEVQLFMANHLWIPIGAQLKPEFTAMLSKNYGGEISTLDLLNQAEESRLKINKWAENKTQSKIKDLLVRGSITASTKFVLTNAIYFKGNWVKAFDKKLSKDSLFKAAGAKEETLIPFMFSKEKTLYTHDKSGALMVELPYRGNKFVMDLILPNPKEDPNASGKGLSLETFNLMLKNLGISKVDLSIPKFKIESSLDFGAGLSKLGMPLAFDPDKADFSGIEDAGSGHNLFISKVIQKTYIETDETGSEAAAATAGTFKMGAIRAQQEPTFKADRPFTFLIRDKVSGAILFIGRFAEPTHS